MHPSVTAETFSCSISAGLTKYSAVRFFQGPTAECQRGSEKVEDPPQHRLLHWEKLQTLVFVALVRTNAAQDY